MPARGGRGGGKTLRSFPGQLAGGSGGKYDELCRKRICKGVGTTILPQDIRGISSPSAASALTSRPQEAQLFLPTLSISVAKVRSVKGVLFPLCRSVYPGQRGDTAHPPPWGR